jgi:hypothetical protein
MKKVLSFVLVLAMILGSVSFAFAFTDDAAITNEEAAKVLSAAGIPEGYTDGSFQPNGILTRAEGAAISARMLLGKSEAAKLSTVVSPFNDVPASHWAAGYIAYCVAQGLLNGYGDGNFGPEDTLTVAAFGKMMLTALGYRSENEGFVGDGWETKVGSTMVKAELTDGVTMTNSAACSRQVAAQVALNTLKANLVDYASNGVSVNTGGATVTVGASKAEAKTPVEAGCAANEGNIKADGIAQFAEKYQEKLKLTAVAEDFGRPGAKKWTFDNKKVYTKKSTSKLVATYTTKVANKDMYTLLENAGANDAKVSYDVIVDGYSTVSGPSIKNNLFTKNQTGDFQGNGAQIEVYFDSTDTTRASNGAVTIVVYNYYLIQAAADYNSKNEEVVIKPISDGLTLTSSKLSKADFDVTNVKKDDYLVVTGVKATNTTLEIK